MLERRKPPQAGPSRVSHFSTNPQPPRVQSSGVDSRRQPQLGENLGQDVALAKNLDFVPVDFDIATTVLAVDHDIADGY